MLTTDQIDNFIEIWEKNFGEKITREEALNHGMKLIRIVQIIMKGS